MEAGLYGHAAVSKKPYRSSVMRSNEIYQGRVLRWWSSLIAEMAGMGLFKKMLVEALPFVARSPEMQVDWLVGEIRKGVLSDREIAPYIHLLVAEYVGKRERGECTDDLQEIFARLPREIIVAMVRCVEIYDIPDLLGLIRELTVDDAILLLKKEPPPYEKRSLFLLDRIFQAVNSCGDHLLERAARKMAKDGDAPGHFASAYERFREILIDEKILALLYPQAKV